MRMSATGGTGLFAVVLSVLLAACAEGVAPEPPGSGVGSLTELPPQMPFAGTSAEPIVDAGPPPFMGEPCTMGQTAVCVCADTGTEGVKTCLFDMQSPTMGAFGMCTNCPPPPPPDAGMPDSGPPDAGATEPPPEPEPMCVPADCPASGLFSTPCCTSSGECGTEILGRCN